MLTRVDQCGPGIPHVHVIGGGVWNELALLHEKLNLAKVSSPTEQYRAGVLFGDLKATSQKMLRSPHPQSNTGKGVVLKSASYERADLAELRQPAIQGHWCDISELRAQDTTRRFFLEPATIALIKGWAKIL